MVVTCPSRRDVWLRFVEAKDRSRYSLVIVPDAMNHYFLDTYSQPKILISSSTSNKFDPEIVKLTPQARSGAWRVPHDLP